MIKYISNFLENRKINKAIDSLTLALTSFGYTLQYIDDETNEVCFFDAIGEKLIISFEQIIDSGYTEHLITTIEDYLLLSLESLGYEFIDYLDFHNNQLPLQFICKDLESNLEVILSIGQVLGLKSRQ